jgi:hypothetical protein
MKRILIVGLIVLSSVALGVAGDEQGHGAPPVEDPRFDFLKSLEGNWSGEPMQEGMPPSRIEFRVTAGGHAVEEREFAGTPMEMLTVYHMEGSALMATHYCVLGNQPRFTSTKKIVDGGLEFDCAGKPGNAASHDDEHVHAFWLRLEDDEHLQYGAELVKNGDVTEAPSMVLTRESKTASR